MKVKDPDNVVELVIPPRKETALLDTLPSQNAPVSLDDARSDAYHRMDPSHYPGSTSLLRLEGMQNAFAGLFKKGAKIKQARELLGLSREEMAVKLKIEIGLLRAMEGCFTIVSRDIWVSLHALLTPESAQILSLPESPVFVTKDDPLVLTEDFQPDDITSDDITSDDTPGTTPVAAQTSLPYGVALVVLQNTPSPLPGVKI